MSELEVIEDLRNKFEIIKNENNKMRKSNMELKQYKIKANARIRQMELDNYNMGQMIIILEQAVEDLE